MGYQPAIWLLGACCITLALYFGTHALNTSGICRIGGRTRVLLFVILCGVGADLSLAEAFVFPVFSASFRDELVSLQLIYRRI